MRLALIMRATRQQMSLQAGVGQEEHNACVGRHFTSDMKGVIRYETGL